MNFAQKFEVSQPMATLWNLFDQPETVAECLPGMEGIKVIDNDNYTVRVRQGVGPISATFEARVHIDERHPQDRLAFSATGKAISGAVGSFRASSVVTLSEIETGTRVRVDSEVVLAGVLGSVGQKVIAKQAEKVAAQFAEALERKLNGTSSPVASGAATPARVSAPQLTTTQAAQAAPTASDSGWTKVAVALGAVNTAIGLAILVALT
jgi:Uncharacterized conserved protein